MRRCLFGRTFTIGVVLLATLAGESMILPPRTYLCSLLYLPYGPRRCLVAWRKNSQLPEIEMNRRIHAILTGLSKTLMGGRYNDSY